MSLLLVLLLVVLLVAALPSWPYARDWGYAPSGGLLTLLVVLLVLMLVGVLPMPHFR